MRIVGDYALGARLGHGATSEVYAAEHRRSGNRVALKLLHEALARDDAAIRELADEAAKLRAIRHPNVVRVLDAGSDAATGRGYLAIERVDGESLAARLVREGRLPEAEVRRLGAEIADGLAAVHAAGLVHRDLKPANVMLDGACPKLVDFGIAKFLGGDAALATSRRIGTPAYMAPEQLVGGLIAPCVDVWALGVLLFEAATGRLPFEDFAGGRCPQLFEAAPRSGSLAPVSPALERLIARCLERDPGRRPASMAAVARALRGEPDGAAEDELAAGPDEARITEDAGPIAAVPPAMAVPMPSVPAPPFLPPPLQPPPLQPPPLQPPPFQSPAPSFQPSWPGVQPTAPRPAQRRRWYVVVVGLAAAAGAALLVVGMVGGGGDSSSAPPAPVASTSAPLPDAAEPAPLPDAAEPARPEPAPPPSRPPSSRPPPFTPRRATLAVDLRSSPPGAQIYLGGKLLGTTPRRLELPGPATLTLRRSGYQPARVRAARPGPLDIRLTRACAQPPCEDLN